MDALKPLEIAQRPTARFALAEPLHTLSLLAVALFVLQLGVVWLLPIPNHFRSTAGGAFQVVQGVLAAVALFAAARRSETRAGHLSTAWRLLAIAQALMVACALVWLVLEAGFGQNAFAGLADLVYLAFYPFAIAGLLLLPTQAQSRAARNKLVLDIGVIVAASSLMYWLLVFDPLFKLSNIDSAELGLTLVSPALDLLLLWTVAGVLLRQARPAPALIVYCVAMACLAAADGVFRYRHAAGADLSGHSLAAILFPLSYLLALMAGVLQHGSITWRATALTSRLGGRALHRLPRTAQALLPYGWIVLALAVVLFTFSDLDKPIEPHDFLIVLGSLCVAMLCVMTRQSLTARENEELTEQQGRLLQVSQLLARPLDPRMAPGRILAEVNELVPNDESFLVTLRDDDAMVIAGTKSWTAAARNSVRISKRPALAPLLDAAKPMVLSDAHWPPLPVQCVDALLRTLDEGRRALWPGRAILPMHAWVAVPLRVDERRLGLLCLGSSEARWDSQAHLETLAAFGRQAAATLENARLRQHAALAAATAERSRLSRELHDSVLQAIFGVSLGLRTAQHHVVGVNKPADDAIQYSLRLAEGAISEMRALIFELRPETLTNEGLVAALTKQATALCDRHGITATVEAAKMPELSDAAQEALYRIAVEAVQNTIKHAHATRVTIRLEAQEGVLSMTVADNGTGFDTRREYTGHLGLVSMRERAAYVGATLTVHSVDGEGATVAVRLRLLDAE
jgi:signal transduction histidine kinase